MMHDWTLLMLIADWIKDEITITFRSQQSEETCIVAEQFSSCKIPKLEEWGKSASVNQVKGPISIRNGNYSLTIEMQSGDEIQIVAKIFHIPE